MQNIHKIVSKEMFFLLAVIIYSLFSNTAPKNIAIPEILIVLFLIFSLNINIENLKNFYTKEKNYIFLIIFLFLITLNFIDLKNAFLNNKINQVFRDYIGFIFIFIPYAFLCFQNSKKNNLYFIPLSLCIGGLLIIYYRLFVHYFLISGKSYYRFIDLSYVYNDSLITFSINFLIFYSITRLSGLKKYIILIFTFFTILFLLHFTEPSGTKIYEINLYYIFSILLFYFVFEFLKKRINFNYFFSLITPKIFNLVILSLIIITFYLLYELNFLNKFLNSRDKEIDYFLNYFYSGNYIEIFFGKGIGSVFYINYDNVTLIKMGFIHIFPLYLILKIGLVGFLILLIYFNKIFLINKLTIKVLFKNILLNKNNVIFHSSFIVLLGSISFYTSFKHLSFWLVMTALTLEINSKLRDDYKN